MTANDIVGDARVARVRELKTALAEAKAQLQQAESERDVLAAHFHLALAALRDFEQLGQEGRLRIIDGWNAILRDRNVSKLTSEDISKLKADYLANLGIVKKGEFVWFPVGVEMDHGATATEDCTFLFITNAPFDIERLDG